MGDAQADDDTPASTVTGELLEQFLAGDRESERLLFERHRAALVERAQGAKWIVGLHKHTTPEDLVQEVFVRALSSGLLLRFENRGRGALVAALSKVLGDVAVDAYRRHGAAKRGSELQALSLDFLSQHGEDRVSHGIAATDTTPTSSARHREMLDRCRAILGAAEWEVWRLCEIEGLGSPAVATRLGTTDSSVRGTLHRARKRILRELASHIEDV